MRFGEFRALIWREVSDGVLYFFCRTHAKSIRQTPFVGNGFDRAASGDAAYIAALTKRVQHDRATPAL